MPVRTDNIDIVRREELRAQGRARQAKLAARKRAEKAACLKPRPEDVDAAMLQALLDFSKLDAEQRKARHSVVKSVYAQTVASLTAGGHQDAAQAVVDRCKTLQTAVPLPKPASPAPETAGGLSTPGDTHVTPADANSFTADRIADPTHA